METLISTVGRAVNGGSVLYIILEIVIFLIGIWILYAVIKSAVKNALFVSRKELDYIIRTALLHSKSDLDSGVKEIEDYRINQFQDSLMDANGIGTDGRNPQMKL